MNLTIFKVNTAVMSEATGLSIQACQLLYELQPSCITTAEIEPIELLHELQDNGLIETGEGMNATLSQAGRELIKDFQLEENHV
ncbi:MAG: hypothetical protein K8R77_06065 [Anaerolineaceae bacterium]|nr:hypothetical protein [Anaerolineaceae bacterium]